MKSISYYKKFGKLCFLAYELAGIQDYRKRWYGSSKDLVERTAEMRKFAIDKSPLFEDSRNDRKLFDAIEYSVNEGLAVLTIYNAPFWEMKDEDLALFMETMEQLQITEFVYESCDSAVFQSFYRLNKLGWKLSGHTRRIKEGRQYKYRNGKMVKRDESEMEYNDFIYGVKIKKNRKNLKK